MFGGNYWGYWYVICPNIVLNVMEYIKVSDDVCCFYEQCHIYDNVPELNPVLREKVKETLLAALADPNTTNRFDWI